MATIGANSASNATYENGINNFEGSDVNPSDSVFASLGRQRREVKAQPKTQGASPDPDKLLESYRAGDKTVVEPLLKSQEGTIDKAIAYFAGGDNGYRTQARLLALNSFNSYDPSKGAALSTHVMNHLQRLQRLTAQRGQLVHIPEDAASQRNAFERARKEIELETGEEPTTAELADYIGVPIKKINKIMAYRGTAAESQTVSGEDGLPVENPTAHALEIYDRYIYEDLDRKDKKIYEWTTGFGGTRTLPRNMIARKLGISQSAVSQRARNIDLKFNRDRELLRKTLYGN